MLAGTDSISTLLNEDKQRIDQAIREYLNTEFKNRMSSFTEISGVSMDAYAKILLNGGKRIRGSLILRCYEYSGGKDSDMALRAAVAIEMVHAYLLVIDDIMDESSFRRSTPSAHKALENYANENDLHIDSLHFGESMAMTAACAGMHIAMNEILSLNHSPEILNQVAREVNESVLVTAHGQFNDMYNETVPLNSVTNQDVMNVLQWKTAQYTFNNPIQVGLLLAGQSKEDTVQFDAYALKTGIAFQIQDDINGMFGDSKKTGKPTIDDLREGKVTLLILEALKRASDLEKQQLISLLDKHENDESDLVLAQDIIRSCGALEAVAAQALEYSDNAILLVDSIPCSKELKGYLKGIAKKVVGRET